MIKTYDDHGRFLLVIEPVDEEAQVLIKKIKKLCGLEGSEVKELKGLEDIPPIPVPVKPEYTPVKDSEISAGLKAYVDACKRVREGKVSAEERADTIAKIKRFAENLKAKVPTGKNLHFIIENMADVFSINIAGKVLNEMRMTSDELVRADEDTIVKAYKIAIS